MGTASDQGRSIAERGLGPLVAAAVVALSLAGGGYSPVVVGAASLLAWIGLIGVVILGGPGTAQPAATAIWAGGALLGLAALTALSLSWASDAGTGFEDVVRALGYFALFALAALTAGPRTGGTWLRGICVGGVAVAVIALASVLLGIGPGDEQLAQQLPAAGGRLSYPLGYWNALGALMALTLPLLAWLSTEARALPGRALAAAAFVPCATVIYLTSSRGAALAAGLALGMGLVFAGRGRGATTASAPGVLAAVGVVGVAAMRRDAFAAPGVAIGAPEIEVLVAVLIGSAAAFAARVRLGDRRLELPGPRPRARTVFAALAALLVVAAVAYGPSSLLGDFRNPGRAEEGVQGNATAALVSGSGRPQFWGAALDAFASDPIRGIGAGGYRDWWSRHGSLGVPIQNAHSAPLETLAELGLLGGLALLGFAAVVAVAGYRAAAAGRSAGSGAAGAAFAAVAAAGLGASIDWTWEVSACFAPAIAITGLLCGRAFGSPAGTVGSVLVDPALGGYRHLFAPPWLRPAVLRAGLLLTGLAALWAAAVLAISSARLDASEEALSQGDFVAAAGAARAAAAVEPWAAAPRLQSAVIEQATGNYEAAARDAKMAIARSPDDYRPWLAATLIASAAQQPEVAAAYSERVFELAPLVLPRGLQLLQ